MSNVQLHFGLYNNTGWSGIRAHAVTIQYSTDGKDWTDMDKTTVPRILSLDLNTGVGYLLAEVASFF